MYYLKLDDLVSCYPQACIAYQTFQFNGGEQHMRVDLPEDFDLNTTVVIEVSLTNSNKIMQTLMATDALRRQGVKNIALFAPYLPYARQDRICNEGEALSVAVMCNLINQQNYKRVYTLDNHSDVSSALLNNYSPIDSVAIFKRTIEPKLINIETICLVSPDAGALKKTYNLAKALNIANVLECSKKRNVVDGKIIETIVPDMYLPIHTVYVIADDICDGGRTFIELAKKLREKNAQHIYLYVSHGIFSQGFEPLFETIDAIFTTKSFKNDLTDTIGTIFYESDFIPC